MRGFTLLEALVSLALALLVIGAAVPLITTNSAVAVAAPEMADEQQRARAAADALARDLALAGAGMSLGPHAGGLVRAFAPILPRRVGQTSADPFTEARADVLTIVYVPPTYAQALLAQPMASPLDPMTIDGSIGCPLFTQACGLQQGSTAVLFDGAGRFDLVGILAIQPGLATVEHRQQNPPDFVYTQGAGIAEAESHTYYFDSAALQLRHYDGAQTDVPVIDNVVDVAFEYFGDPEAPDLPRPPAGVANCLYDAAGVRLPRTTLASNGSSLVPLPLSLFTDGPWCGAGSFRYDADLLRIRLVRVRLSVQVGNLMMRGATADFRHAGRGRSALRNVPDYTMRFDVTPRNLSPAR